MALAPGAVQLPQSHLSVRVPWHDTDWTGRVCDRPGENHSCSVLRNIKEKKNAEAESDDPGTAWADLARERVPPCVFERGGFMRESTFSIARDHAYAGGWTKSHAHFATTTQRMPARSIEATPYRWVMREHAEMIADVWGVGYDRSLEDYADTVIEKRRPTNWVQDHRNQLALLDSFFSAIVPRSSLVFFYAKDVPLLEETPAGLRVLVGAGVVTDVGPTVEWEYNGSGPLRSIMWERAVGHSVVAPSFADGFLLPYQQLLTSPGLRGRDLTELVAIAPSDSFEEFSYVTALVSHDSAVGSLKELARVVDLLKTAIDGPWSGVDEWISDRLAEVWDSRGPFPGLGAALTAAGLGRGAVLAQRVISSMADPDDDPWPALERAIADVASGAGPAADLVPRMAKKVWDRFRGSPERYELLRLLSRFALTNDQARRMLSLSDRTTDGSVVNDAEILSNPYLLYELDRLRRDQLSLGTIDRGIFPRSARTQAVLATYPLPEPIDEAADDRRLRAAAIQILEAAAGEGHALLDEPRIRQRMAAMPLDPLCDPTTELFALATST